MSTAAIIVIPTCDGTTFVTVSRSPPGSSASSLARSVRVVRVCLHVTAWLFRQLVVALDGSFARSRSLDSHVVLLPPSLVRLPHRDGSLSVSAQARQRHGLPISAVACSWSKSWCQPFSAVRCEALQGLPQEGWTTGFTSQETLTANTYHSTPTSKKPFHMETPQRCAGKAGRVKDSFPTSSTFSFTYSVEGPFASVSQPFPGMPRSSTTSFLQSIDRSFASVSRSLPGLFQLLVGALFE